ncbi:UDP-3-O-(3-hydroxymyristoyl)glucosamine N-acyltransferase [Uliginosibacterium sp. 31-12]|uniref:UDP-3-O-(3-hydroxymyristoyl)glucosamine N-acyltransferase n=1 Tax=Uliginosibacterium sp. 31-12 TaxID=3062781 RepID=UPI0026E21E06|nr:UDP-3-O-(3-hydroxymyristoyl)glucosamine N-acyltransferase [Uliginosibacterium sp. 31-12]MDO6385229.1 UDP-3-O-(3-hydroxymyristoyl)glucosamine N-acyltransferase [Uliginosibacterium sp. 31-12]
MNFSLQEIVELLGGELRGDASVSISQVAPLERASIGEIGFVVHPKYRQALVGTQAAAVILPVSMAEETALPRIIAADPHLYFARVAQLLNPAKGPSAGIHPRAVVLSELPDSVSVGAMAYVGEGCIVGENVVIGPGCVVEQGVSIGEGSTLRANVTVYADCIVGKNCILHAGSVVGSDGFGYARHKDGRWEKIPQIGRAVLGDGVELGANVTVDRGALDDTVIGNGVKIDNLCHIAHNCVIGDNTAMAAQVGIAGSSRVGSRVMLAGQVGVNGHIEIGNDILISGATAVTKDIKQPGVYTAMFPAEPHKDWMRNAARFKRIEAMYERIRDMEKKLEELENKK